MAHTEPQQLEANHRPPNSFPLPIPPQPQDRALHDTASTGIQSVTGIGQLQVQWGDVSPTIGNGAAQWNPHHANVDNHRTGDFPDLAGDLAGPYMDPNVGPAHQQDHIPGHMQVMFHENPGNDYFGGAPRDFGPGPTQAQDSNANPSTHRVPDMGQPAADLESLRRLASRYVYHPDSQVVMVRMEPGSAGRYKVVIVLDMADFP